jgi:putative redox protein
VIKFIIAFLQILREKFMQEMYVTARLLGGMHFNVTTGSGHSVELDMLDGQKQAMGASPMEMLLVALAGCTGITVLSILYKRHMRITGYTLRVHGKRAEQHPRVYTEITVEHELRGENLSVEWVERAIELSETRYCGVEAMLSKTARITHTYTINP